jgi:integrase
MGIKGTAARSCTIGVAIGSGRIGAQVCNDRGMAKPTKTPAGNYRVIVDFGGRRKSATFPTLKAARAGQARMLVELGSKPTALTATVETIVADYIDTAGSRLSPNYTYNAHRAIGIMPASFASMPADAVTVFQVEAMYRALLADGRGSHVVHRLHGVLVSAFKRAARYQLVTVNPMPSVESPPVERAVIVPPTPAQVRAVIGAAGSPLCALAYSLAAATGARRGELVGLQWGDIDFNLGRISIVRSLAHTPGVGLHERPTKTGVSGHRQVTIDPATMGLLAARRVAYPSGEWILSPTHGLDPWKPDALSQAFVRDCKAAGLSGFTFNGLRHFHATQLLSDGATPWTVSRRLGHTNPTTTVTNYAKWIPGSDGDKAAAEAIARVMRDD